MKKITSLVLVSILCTLWLLAPPPLAAQPAHPVIAQELVVAGDLSGKVHLLQFTGLGMPVSLWTEQLPATVIQGVIAIDLDRDGQFEVLAGGNDGVLYCLDGISGAQRWSYASLWADFYSWRSLFAEDMDADGYLEVITAIAVDSPGNQYYSGSGGGIVVLEHDGSVKLVHESPIVDGWNGNGPDRIRLDDINNDYIDDVVCLYGSVLYPSSQPRIQVVDISTGTPIILYDFTYTLTGSGMTNLAIGDFDADADIDYVTGGWWCPVVAFDTAGASLWTHPASGGNADRTVRYVQDIDGFGQDAILIGTAAYSNTGGLYCYIVDPVTGTDLVPPIPLGISASNFHPFAVANFDGDPAKEIITFSNIVGSTADQLTAIDGATGNIIGSTTFEFVSRAVLTTDLDANGQSELLVADGDGLTLIHSSGVSLWTYPMGVGVYALAEIGPIIGSPLPRDSLAPYVSRLTYSYVNDRLQQIQDLRNGDADFIEAILEWEDIDQLSTELNMDIGEISRDGYGQLVVNCQQYPFNISAFRRAVAYAMDKHSFSEIMWGEAGRPADSHISPSLGVWHNPYVEGLYYDKNLAAAAYELTLAGFLDINDDGLLEAPNGDPFDFNIIYATEAPQWGVGLNELQSNLAEIGISVVLEDLPFWQIQDRVFSDLADYEGAVFAQILDRNWAYLYTRFHSSMPSGENYVHYSSPAADMLLERLISTPRFEEVVSTCWEVQSFLAHELPIIPIYCNVKYKAARTDIWEKPFWTAHPFVTDYWTVFNTALHGSAGGPFGGTFGIDFESRTTLNPIVGVSPNPTILPFLYPSLGFLDPAGIYVGQPGLANEWIIADTPNGMCITFYLDDEVIWSDGESLTAFEVVDAFNYHLNQLLTSYPVVSLITDLEAVDTHTVKITLNSFNYYDFEQLALVPILPAHLIGEVDNLWTYLQTHVISSGPYVCETATLQYQEGGFLAHSITGDQLITAIVPEYGTFVAPNTGWYKIGIDFFGGPLPLDYTVIIEVDGLPYDTIYGSINPDDPNDPDNIVYGWHNMESWAIEDFVDVWLEEDRFVEVWVDFTPADGADLDIAIWAPGYYNLQAVQEVTLVQRSIAGSVVNDRNGDPISGATILLFNEDGSTLLATTQTNTEGLYKFTRLIPGEYWVEIDLGNDLHYTSPYRLSATLGDVVNFAVHPRQLNFELSGSFDFLLKEEIYLRLSGFLTDRETSEPVSGATVIATVYDPTGLILFNASLTEELVHTGIYTHLYHSTMKDLKWPKGIYVVHAHAYLSDRAQAWDMLQFHIDPPADAPIPLIAILGLILMVILVPSVYLLYRYRRRIRPQ